mmetsp:Transcript_24487/g.81372  ORF Transcript_24487/g.81372 Transcript_24487/m.81372 type:complete len:305 (-) Transcript_24487:794-1708(-)
MPALHLEPTPHAKPQDNPASGTSFPGASLLRPRLARRISELPEPAAQPLEPRLVAQSQRCVADGLAHPVEVVHAQLGGPACGMGRAHRGAQHDGGGGRGVAHEERQRVPLERVRQPRAKAWQQLLPLSERDRQREGGQCGERRRQVAVASLDRLQDAPGLSHRQKGWRRRCRCRSVAVLTIPGWTDVERATRPRASISLARRTPLSLARAYAPNDQPVAGTSGLSTRLLTPGAAAGQQSGAHGRGPGSAQPAVTSPARSPSPEPVSSEPSNPPNRIASDDTTTAVAEGPRRWSEARPRTRAWCP